LAGARHSALIAAALSAALLAPASGCAPIRRVRAAFPRVDPPVPFEVATLRSSARALQVGERPPLGHATDVDGGAFVIRDGHNVAVVSGRDGQLVAFGRAGGVDGIDRVQRAAQDPLHAAPATLARIEIVQGRALHVVEQLQTHDAELHAWFELSSGVLTMHSQLVAGRAAVQLTLGESWAWSNTPTWIDGTGFVESGGSYAGRFLGRHSAGIAYAACRADGRAFDARVSSSGLAGFHRRATTGEDRVELAAGEASPLRRVQLAWSGASIGAAVAKLPCATTTTRLPVPVPVSARTIEVASCETPQAWRARRLRSPDSDPERALGTPFLRFDREAAALLLPAADCARVRFTSPGHAAGAWFDPLVAEAWTDPGVLPRAGRLRWRVSDESGSALPHKLEVEGESPTPTPDWGEDTEGGAAKNYAYVRGGGERPLPPGSYMVRAQRGFEYSAESQRVTIVEGQTATWSTTLSRVVATPGYLSADLHVHALPSFDAPILLEDRVLSLAGVGVEVAVATDHNAVTDYRPAIAKLQLERHLASIVGDEVTTEEPEVGHFNVFPLPHPRPPLRWRAATVPQLFDAARSASPDGVLQVNHPRMGSIGYFDILHLDRGDVRGWAERHPAIATRFDAIEVFSGDHYARISAVREVLEDWYALLNAGLRYTATGNSDSHKIAYQDAGMPRNWVAMRQDEPAQLDEAAFTRAVNDGRVIVSSGPFVTLHAGDVGIGGRVAPGRHGLRVHVDAPKWIDVSQVDLVVRGQVVQRWKVPALAAEAAVPHPRLSQIHDLELAAGDWVVAVVTGKRRMAGYYRARAQPFAFTNPIFVE
jgi:hypothetical protein